ncbi:hypothetical protein RND71_025011 [Anisodus tanguticus]|uniref:Uncharacterized protein n=1 Tax=Anisodus tanguticus TaxID=243964 RepID=A0AAE1RQV7_9SOLA|nr:hypothetical protein RND71_025011 [Anisodus tanguticus]
MERLAAVVLDEKEIQTTLQTFPKVPKVISKARHPNPTSKSCESRGKYFYGVVRLINSLTLLLELFLGQLDDYILESFLSKIYNMTRSISISNPNVYRETSLRHFIDNLTKTLTIPNALWSLRMLRCLSVGGSGSFVLRFSRACLREGLEPFSLGPKAACVRQNASLVRDEAKPIHTIGKGNTPIS